MLLVLRGFILIMLLNLAFYGFVAFVYNREWTKPRRAEYQRITRVLGKDIGANCRIERMYVRRAFFGEGKATADYAIVVDTAVFERGRQSGGWKPVDPSMRKEWKEAIDLLDAEKQGLKTMEYQDRAKQIRQVEYSLIRYSADHLESKLGLHPNTLDSATVYEIDRSSTGGGHCTLFEDSSASGTVRLFLRATIVD